MKDYSLSSGLVAAVSVLASLSPSAGWADQVIMKNGDPRRKGEWSGISGRRKTGW